MYCVVTFQFFWVVLPPFDIFFWCFGIYWMSILCVFSSLQLLSYLFIAWMKRGLNYLFSYEVFHYLSRFNCRFLCNINMVVYHLVDCLLSYNSISHCLVVWLYWVGLKFQIIVIKTKGWLIFGHKGVKENL